MIQLTIPPELDERYNHALIELPPGKGTLIGNRDKLQMLEDAMLNPDSPSALLLGEQGIGKTAIVEQLSFESQSTDRPFVIVSLSVEALGALETNTMIARMRTLLTDMNAINAATEKANPGQSFQLILFIDEIHKLNRYGLSNGSSGAMNALKEGLARGLFPIVAATTDYEYRKNIMTDPAFDRRFSKVILDEPDHDTTVEILKRRIKSWASTISYAPSITDKTIHELVTLADAFIRNQVNPAKSISLLASAFGHEINQHNHTQAKTTIDHDTLKFVFAAEGYNIDSPATADTVKAEIHRHIKGQPLALKTFADAVNITFYTPRDRKRPFITAFLVGSTGVGKSETAKALAKALYGREDAMLVLNGGDYTTPEDAIKAQHFIGDSMAVSKQKVILLDEIEKSHPDVTFAYMRMIDEGIVRDSLDTERSVNNTAILATSNLGARIFDDLQSSMNLEGSTDPDEFSQTLYDAWIAKDADVRNALIEGDTGKNNGIKPEFLERFKSFIPYLPLAVSVKAQITRIKLEKFQAEMKQIGYRVLLPRAKSAEWWEEHMHNHLFKDIDPVSVMIAQDMINGKAVTTGARAIDRIIDSSIKAKIAQMIADRTKAGQSVDGGFIVNTNGHAVFEKPGHDPADVNIEYKAKEELK